MRRKSCWVSFSMVTIPQKRTFKTHFWYEIRLELFMRISTNYKQLQTIYFQRKHHKLKEDWGAICEMIENLPHSELIIGSHGTDSKGQVGASCDRVRP